MTFVAGMLLAAGESRRMGRPKPLLLVDGEPFLLRIRRALADGGLDPIRIVLGHQADEITSRCLLDGAEIVINPAYVAGMLSSLIAGIRSIELTPATALVLALVDGPDIHADVVRQLVAIFEATGAPIVEPTFGGEHGHPVLLARSTWPDLLAADPAVGAKGVVRRYRPQGVQVPVDDPGVLVDLDTPAEFAAWANGR